MKTDKTAPLFLQLDKNRGEVSLQGAGSEFTHKIPALSRPPRHLPRPLAWAEPPARGSLLFFATHRPQSSNSCPGFYVRVPRGFGVLLPGGWLQSGEQQVLQQRGDVSAARSEARAMTPGHGV